LRRRILGVDPDDPAERLASGSSRPISSLSYDGAFAATEEMVALLSSYSSLDSLSELLSSHETRPRFPENHRSVPRLVKWLVASSHAFRYDDLDKMLDLANMARLAADACTPSAASSQQKLADLRVRAWGQFGNALRVRGLLQEAEDAINTAHRYQAAGTGDPEIRGRLLQQTVSLHIHATRFQDAAQTADEASKTFVRLGQFHQYASTLVQKAISCMWSGDPKESFRLLKKALPLIDPDDEPELLLAARQNLLLCYMELEMAREADLLLRETEELFTDFRNPLILLRLEWNEGKLLRDLGDLQAAEQKLSRARDGFLYWQLPYELAEISLDLSEVYLRQGALQKVAQIAREMIPLCRALQLGREVLAFLLHAREASSQAH
jgi:tetratricopeptide (TPR) repeat protein